MRPQGTDSCNGSLRSNWRLIQYDTPLIDYIITHELTHGCQRRLKTDPGCRSKAEPQPPLLGAAESPDAR
ncbi:M48 family peptidase [Lautropia dentalis]|uniref:M48 family peptidase n=1 Tax=Lautropia dentalis TaxID=2490857 RepID=A0A426FPQ5_9BURK|nr:M48 family peptidase [Lautropia dentalis]